VVADDLVDAVVADTAGELRADVVTGHRADGEALAAGVARCGAGDSL